MIPRYRKVFIFGVLLGATFALGVFVHPLPAVLLAFVLTVVAVWVTLD